MRSGPLRDQRPSPRHFPLPLKSLSICRAQLIDRDVVVALLVAQTSDHGMETTHRQLSAIVDKILADEPHGFLLVAKCDSEVVGVAYVANRSTLLPCDITVSNVSVALRSKSFCRKKSTATEAR